MRSKHDLIRSSKSTNKLQIIIQVKQCIALTKAPGLAIDGIFWENIIHTLFHFINYSVSSFTYSIFFSIFIISWFIYLFISWQRERREWMPGVKIKGKHQIVGGILGRNREVYLGTWLVHFKSVSHTFMSRKTCQV